MLRTSHAVLIILACITLIASAMAAPPTPPYSGASYERTVAISPGWSTISTPFTVDPNTTTATNIDAAYFWDGTSWVTVTTASGLGNPGDAAYIYLTSGGTVHLVESKAAPTFTKTRELSQGFNFIGISANFDPSGSWNEMTCRPDYTFSGYTYLIKPSLDASNDNTFGWIHFGGQGTAPSLTPLKGYWVYEDAAGANLNIWWRS